MPKPKRKLLDRTTIGGNCVFVETQAGSLAVCEQAPKAPYLQYRAPGNVNAEKGMPECCVQVDAETGEITIQLKAGVKYSVTVVE